jgi:hypothetical protein
VEGRKEARAAGVSGGRDGKRRTKTGGFGRGYRGYERLTRHRTGMRTALVSTCVDVEKRKANL